MASASLVPVDELFTYAERLALIGFLAAYRGASRDAYAGVLRQCSSWGWASLRRMRVLWDVVSFTDDAA
jgi:hypothetical protein